MNRWIPPQLLEDQYFCRDASNNLVPATVSIMQPYKQWYYTQSVRLLIILYIQQPLKGGTGV